MSKIISPQILINFYKQGLFPMAENLSSNNVNLYRPKKRFLIPINTFHVPKKLFKLFKKSNYTYRLNNNFEHVISQCQLANRRDNGTWINDIILNSYINLYHYKMCHSIECYDENKLIAGLYGVHIGGSFFGESMFSIVSNTSKFCLLYLIAILKKNLFSILDSQFYNDHLTQFGAYELNNDEYLRKLKNTLNEKKNFAFIDDFHEVLSLIQPNSHKS
ncbi:leucyl/phenylalanyl-tRNA--protein transferase [Pelagibacterales bacterium SAG-MED31]|nr:leucyl/phenylalanyl-tRNA--protein transferase [Pelagibacterales bacterium SAG-MED31]